MAGILLTGASGFIGRQLLPRLVEAFPSTEILAVRGRNPLPIAASNVRSLSIDLGNAVAVNDMIRIERPDVVIHLAAQSSVAQALAEPWQVWKANFEATLTLAEAVKGVRPDAAFVFASTAEVYGAAFAAGATIDETSPLGPANPYARSKTACEYALRDLWAPQGQLVLLRIFNHIGPGQDERFVASAFAAQIARIEAGRMEPVINVGDLSVERDFGDVIDLIDALVTICLALDDLDKRAVFNICSGNPRPVQALLDGLIAIASVRPEVRIEPGRIRAGELRRVSGSNAALRAATGWQPRQDLTETLERLLSYWREQVAREV